MRTSPGAFEDEVRLDLVALEVGGDDPRVVVDAPAPVRVRGDRAAIVRALANLLQNARSYGPRDGRITVAARHTDGFGCLSVSDEGPGLSVEEAEHAFERFWRKRHTGAGAGLGLAIVAATAQRHGGRARRTRLGVHDRTSGSHGLFKRPGYNGSSTEERTTVRIFRQLSTPRLLGLLAAVAAVAVGASVVAMAALGSSSPTPPAKPLDQALRDAASAAGPTGVTARVQFTNNLFPSGSLSGITGKQGSALQSSATGRLWWSNDGRGRIELQSDAGDTQILWSRAGRHGLRQLLEHGLQAAGRRPGPECRRQEDPARRWPTSTTS